MSKLFFYLAVIVLCLFDQQPSYPEQAFEQGLVITPWSPIPLIRLNTMEVIMTFIVLGMLFTPNHKTKVSWNKNPDGVMKGQMLFLGMTLLGIIVGVLTLGPVTTIWHQTGGMIHGALIFFLTITMCQDDGVRRKAISLLFVCSSLKSFQGIYFLVFGGYGRALPDGTPLIFYDQTACILMCVVILTVIFSYRELSAGQKFLAVISIVPALISFILSYRRNLYLGIAFATGIIVLQNVWQRPKLLKRIFVYLAIASVLSIIIVSQILPKEVFENISDRITSSFEFENSATGAIDDSNFFRLIETVNVWENYKLKPFFGAGFGGRYDVVVYPPGMDDTFIQDVNNVVHNSYLGILYKTGAVGFFMFMTGLYFIGKRLHGMNSGDYGIVKISFFVFLMYLVSNFFMPNIFFEKTMSFLSLLTGFSYCTLQKIETEKGKV